MGKKYKVEITYSDPDGGAESSSRGLYHATAYSGEDHNQWVGEAAGWTPAQAKERLTEELKEQAAIAEVKRTKPVTYLDENLKEIEAE